MHYTSAATAILLTSATLVTAYPQARSANDWVAATSTDSRSPCPMLNSLANHAYLPHDGKNISLQNFIDALSTAINLAESATRAVAATAFTVTSTSGYADTINLVDLLEHGVIEHDASLSRADSSVGDALNFDESIWASSFAFFTSTSISVAQMAAARAARIAAAASSLGAAALQGGLLETAVLMRFFEDGTDTADRNLVDIFMREERLPFAEGWTKSTTEVGITELSTLAAKINAA